MEHYGALKRKGTVIHVTMLVPFEDVVLSAISQSQKDQYCRFHVFEVPRVVRFAEIGSGMVAARDWGAGDWDFLFDGDRV